MLSNAINFAQDILNYYIIGDYLRINCDSRVVFPFSGSGKNDERFTKTVAEILKIEVASCALKGFQVPSDPKKFNQIAKFCRNIESRYSLKKQLDDSANIIQNLVEEKTTQEVKEAIRDEALKLAECYNKYIEDLACYKNYVTVESEKINGMNTLYLAKTLIKPRARVDKLQGSISEYGTAAVLFNQDPYTIYYEQLLSNQKVVFNKLKTCRWQWDLFSCRCDLESDLGERDRFTKLSESKFWKYVSTLLDKAGLGFTKT